MERETEGGKRQARRDSKGRVAGEWESLERREMKEGDEEEPGIRRKAKESGGGRAFPPSRLEYPQRSFHLPSYPQPRLKKTPLQAPNILIYMDTHS